MNPAPNIVQPWVEVKLYRCPDPGKTHVTAVAVRDTRCQPSKRCLLVNFYDN